MDDLQYSSAILHLSPENTGTVLNLVINGWPSILRGSLDYADFQESFKPCYKWMTFNTPYLSSVAIGHSLKVLNLVINGWPSIQDLCLWVAILIVLF